MVKKLLRVTGYAALVVVVAIIACNLWVVLSTRNRIFDTASELPANKVALVLGTSNKLTDGSPNPFFHNRIQTAVYLFNQGKVSHFIVSGDNRTVYYNEPQEMKKALVKAGVPDSIITLDYAGLRTLDSIIRSKEIFGQDKLTIITQPFHCYRALFICRYYGIEAVAVLTTEPSQEDAFPVYIREYLARTKAIIDLYILKTAPRHLGDKEKLKR